ncbi:hypothetical protein KJ909_02990 [Patescibacteria group bacterium]|nr:hypothetical protein [Patescibacteria group bacterium]
MYKVLVTTSGMGSRLGELVADTNKSLVLLKEKPIIDYIIESYPENVEIVFTLGYFGDKVKKYLVKNYPKRKFTYVVVDKYQGEGSSLGYSMLMAERQLQCPFIFHCNDTLANGPIPSPEEYNWNGGSKGQDVELFNTQRYSSFSVKNGFLTVMNRKGATDFDLFHIGLVGFKDYGEFWKNLRGLYEANPNDSSLNDCAAMQVMLRDGFKFKSVEFPRWLDTGNLEVLAFAKKKVG